MRIEIERLVWDDWNREHILKHKVTVDEDESGVVLRLHRPPSEPARASTIRLGDEGGSAMTKHKPTIDFGYPTEPQGRIPGFQDIEEEAEFWDTHDLVDIDGPASVWTVYEGSESAIGDPHIEVLLDPNERRALVDQAHDRNVDPSVLATVWLQDRLRQELEKQAS